jgi:hypothetical protein
MGVSPPDDRAATGRGDGVAGVSGGLAQGLGSG